MTIDLDVAIRLLRLLTPMAASLALSTVAVGLVTSHWLYSEEKMPNPKFNRTGDPELEFLSKFTTSGLWDLCYINRNDHLHGSLGSNSPENNIPLILHNVYYCCQIKTYIYFSFGSFSMFKIAGETERYCFNIDYFPKEEYSPDPNDSTLSIPCKLRIY